MFWLLFVGYCIISQLVVAAFLILAWFSCLLYTSDAADE